MSVLFGPDNDRRLGQTSAAARKALVADKPRRVEPLPLSALPNGDLPVTVKAAPIVSDAQRKAKFQIFNLLCESVDFSAMTTMKAAKAKHEVAIVITEIIRLKGMRLSVTEQDWIITNICDDLFGFGPLEPLLARQDIGDIMVNGYKNVFIETGGVIEKTDIQFRDNKHLMDICKRIVSRVGRNIDAANPVCDARLEDGSRVNVIAPPLALHGPALTIRKFRSDRLRLRDLVDFGSLSPAAARLIAIIGASQCNVLISGGTGSGKTTLLNCITAFFDSRERIITLEDAAELQLQQPHVVSLETRPPNIEGKGEITMSALMRNCLRMRPERIIMGEVRGVEALDLLQAMNTGHDGSMGTLHANTPRDALSRLEAMISMGGSTLPIRTIREMIVGSVDIILQTSRLRDGSRRITHITEIVGLNGDVITTQDLMVYNITGEDARGNLTGEFSGTGITKPQFWDKAKYFGLGPRLDKTMHELADKPQTKSDVVARMKAASYSAA